MYRTFCPSRIPQAAVEAARGTTRSPDQRDLVRRERDFGIGYGRSSGYASQRSYAAPQAAYFRCR